YFVKTSAALRIATRLSGLWPLMGIFLVIPAILRNPVYDLIARYRYQWFGKRESCMIPTPELRSRFL
ncbi:MAG: thiol-disulfide oxidoreductase DCC family protein, partial [Bacteroidota bacterium]